MTKPASYSMGEPNSSNNLNLVGSEAEVKEQNVSRRHTSLLFFQVCCVGIGSHIKAHGNDK